MFSGKHLPDLEKLAASIFRAAQKYSFFLPPKRWRVFLDNPEDGHSKCLQNIVSTGGLHHSATLHSATRYLLLNISRLDSGLILKGQMSEEIHFFTENLTLEDEITMQSQNFWQQTPSDRAQYPSWMKTSTALL